MIRVKGTRHAGKERSNAIAIACSSLAGGSSRERTPPPSPSVFSTREKVGGHPGLAPKDFDQASFEAPFFLSSSVSRTNAHASPINLAATGRSSREKLSVVLNSFPSWYVRWSVTL